MNYLTGQGRQKESFHRGWFFSLRDLKEEDGTGADTAGMQSVTLPHDWSVEYPFNENAPTCGSGGYLPAGTGWYKKKFRISEAVKGKRILLYFEGAYMDACVWVNGRKQGRHIYGYTPFEFDITDAVRWGEENLVSVRIDNSRQPGSRWYSGSGITRNVWLKAVDSLHVDTFGTYITAPYIGEKTAVVRVETTLTDSTAESQQLKNSGVSLTTEIFLGSSLMAKASCIAELPDGTNPASRTVTISQELSVGEPLLWNTESPTLYRAVTHVYRGDVEVDTVSTDFGIRAIEFNCDRGFLLNGRQVKINGVCLHHDGGCLGAAVPKKVWRYRLLKLKEMGCNAVRFSHNPPNEELLDLCDEMGFLAMDEAFDEWRYLKAKELGSNTHESRGYSEWFSDHHEEDLTTMLLRDRNHPCVILWSIGNEVPDQTAEDGAETARLLKGICNRLDPTRPVTQANDQIEAEPRKAREDFLEVLDVVGYNYVNRWREREETLYGTDKLRYPKRCLIGSENISAAVTRGRYPITGGSLFWEKPYYTAPVAVGRVLRYTMTHDFVAGDFMWTGIDYLGEAGWPERSASCGVLDTCGYEKDSYYFYQSIWRRDIPVLHLCPHWNLDSQGYSEGQIVKLLCFTNCDMVELFVDGVSYGTKASSYPAYGMTECYGHYDSERVYPDTENLFLAWDVPYVKGEITAVGYREGQEWVRKSLRTTGPAVRLVACPADTKVQPDGLDTTLVFIKALDAEGNVVPDADIPFTVRVRGGGELLGTDNGNPAEHRSFHSREYDTFAGLALLVIRGTAGAEEDIRVEIEPKQTSVEGDSKLISIKRD